MEQLQNIVYVADSALVTEESLKAMGDDISFISHVPENFNLPYQLTEAAFTRGKWLELGRITPGKKSASYKVQEFEKELYGRRYRFLVVHSDHLDKRKLRGLDSRLKKQRQTLEKAAREMAKMSFACEADAKEALHRFIKENQNEFYPLEGQVVKTHERIKRSKKGRPGKNETPEYREIYKLHIEVGELDQKAYERKKEHISCFVLISNVSTDYSSYDILKEYKRQTVVENRFKFVKHPLSHYFVIVLLIFPFFLEFEKSSSSGCGVVELVGNPGRVIHQIHNCGKSTTSISTTSGGIPPWISSGLPYHASPGLCPYLPSFSLMEEGGEPILYCGVNALMGVCSAFPTQGFYLCCF